MPESTDVGIPYVSPRDFYGVNNIDFDNAKKITEKSYLEMSKKMAPELHDIIFSRYASLGEIRYVVTTERFLVSYSCVIIKPNYEMTYPKYLYYYLHSDNIVQEISYYSNANTQANVGIDSINRFKVIIPNVKEQREIVDYLDAKCSAIDATIQKRELAIEKLTAYKQSLIYECVTGKREVLA
jgi:type I restriction enzyme S subunit